MDQRSQRYPPRGDGLVAFHCRLDQHVRWVRIRVFGAVEETVVASAGLALIYANRAYGSPARLLAGAPCRARMRTRARHCVSAVSRHSARRCPPPCQNAKKPSYGINLSLVEGDQRRLMDSLRAGEIELAMLYDFDLDDEFHVEPLQDLKVYALMAGSDRLAKRDAVRLADLARRPLVLLDVPLSRDYFLSLFRDAGLKVESYRSSSIEMVRGLVGHGLGFSLLATRPSCNLTADGRALACPARRTDDARGRAGWCWHGCADAQPGQVRDIFRNICRENLAKYGNRHDPTSASGHSTHATPIPNRSWTTTYARP
ncbi:MAG: LysR substrate-binding domain-containing protein [Geminicoccaceae bacterium]